MSTPRQQRTLSRRRFDPGQGPLPILIDMPNSGAPTGGPLSLFFSVPVVMRGIPPVLNNAGDPPATAVQISETQIDLEWLGQPVAGDVLTLQQWTPTLRGLNGEWIAPGRILVGGGAAGAMPPVAICQGVQNTGGSDAQWSFSPAVENIPAAALVVNGVQANSYSVVSPGILLANYPVTVNAGDGWSIGTWLPVCYDPVAGLWLAPGIGQVF